MRSWAVYLWFTLLCLNTNVDITTSVEIKTLRSEGIFKTFLRNLFDTLLDFPITEGADFQGLSPYLFILGRCVGEMGYRQTKKLARFIDSLSQKNQYDIRKTLRRFRRDLEDKLRWRVKFLKAMNSIFSSEHSFIFHDYIRELKRYGKKEADLPIVEETRVILDYVILNRVMQLRSRDRRSLKKKMKNAIKEYDTRHSVESHSDSRSSATSDEISSESSYSSDERLKKKMYVKTSPKPAKIVDSKIVISVRK